VIATLSDMLPNKIFRIQAKNATGKLNLDRIISHWAQQPLRGFASDEDVGQAARGDGVGEVSRALAVDGGEGLTGGGVDEVGGG